MVLSFEELKDKIKGCWTGKNIGGVLGAPFECYRQVNDVSFYVQDLKGNPPPNDDLDLQLVWLNAVEKFGRQVDASILGEYWLSYIIPHWVEYGTGKVNLSAGLMPPLSGYIENKYKDSCGCFIRSEIWACLAPGHPELAVRYSYEDAIVDHAEEGMYAEIFCAAVQSAAFVESDKYRLIDIGLSYIPEDSAVAKGVNIAISCYKAGETYIEARKKILTEVPGTFGIQNTKIKDIKEDFKQKPPGFDAPSNIGFTIVGWLYGEDDFAKSLCIAVNCGEDTDCTAATLGAILGIIHGDKALPKEWTEPLGGIINTCCINRLSDISIPDTVDELTDRILRVIPNFLGHTYCDILYSGNGFTLKTLEKDQLSCENEPEYILYVNGGGKPKDLQIKELLALSPYGVKYNFSTFYAVLEYCDGPFVKLNEPKKLKLTIRDNGLTRHQQWVDIKIYSPDGVTIAEGKHFSAPLQNTYKYAASAEFTVITENLTGGRIELLIDISVLGRHTNGVIKAVLYPH